MKTMRKFSKKKKPDPMRLICWLFVPVTMVVLVAADAIGIFTFTKENLMVIGSCLVVILLPFFNEIKVKDWSVKRSESEMDRDT